MKNELEGCLLIFPVMLPAGPRNENGASFLFITYGDDSDDVDGDSDSISKEEKLTEQFSCMEDY